MFPEEWNSLMKVSNIYQEWMNTSEVRKIMAALSKDGEARFVGGCVRDALIDKKITDIDIATTHKPEKTTELLEKTGTKVIPTGIEHGTVTAVINHKKFEITTLRRDVECYGRHAEVEFTDNWQEDAARRDFTMNALSMDMKGEIYDYFEGIDDLNAGKVKFIGDAEQRIKEDYLRILRLFRFHTYYGKGVIDDQQIKIVARNSEGLKSLSGERIQTEMLKILSAPDPFYVIKIMSEAGILGKVIPNSSNAFDLSLLSSLIDIEKAEKITTDPYVRLACIILPNQQANFVQIIADSWKLSNSSRSEIDVLLTEELVETSISEADKKKLIRRIGKKHANLIAIISWTSEINNNPDESKQTNDKFRNFLKFIEDWQIPEFPLRGSDIMALGIKEGKEIGKTLRKAEEYWENRDYKPTKDKLLSKVMRNVLD